MNITEIQTKVGALIKDFDTSRFIYDFLLAYGLPKASITRLQKGNLNMSHVAGEIDWKNKLYYKHVEENDLNSVATATVAQLKHKERFVIVTDDVTLVAIDTKTEEKLDIALAELPKHFDFFLPWAGMEKAQHHDENPADIKAAEKMAKLFDILKKDNPDDTSEGVHYLNVFLSRLLFCFFAEDTNIFEENQFTNAIDSHTAADGSDLHTFLDELFLMLNTPKDKRRSLYTSATLSEQSCVPAYLNAFPYVNGGLFKASIPSPHFTRRSRIAVIDSGGQGWEAINPDIFGSMFQAVISTAQRGTLGQHYTSVPNIMKVIEPLFLNELYEELDAAVQTKNAASQQNKLDVLLHRIHHIKIFDPACGSGNFLIIAYKELRQLEMKIFKAGNMMALSGIHLSQFYGIEIDDFAGEIAKLALWLAEHQMNVAFYKEFGRTNPTLPLREAGNIVQGNACRLDWEVVCPKVEGEEVFILGNPPYLGSSLQTKEQKRDVEFVLSKLKGYKNLDYIACWFYKASDFVFEINSQFAFVTTNSICQGEQVDIIWPRLINMLEINFSYFPFKWSNNAKGQAGVTVVIIGLRNISEKGKYQFKHSIRKVVHNINPYLVEGSNIIVSKRRKPVSRLQEMNYGSKPTDGGNLILSESEMLKLIKVSPLISRYIKKFVGSNEIIKGISRYCIWVEECEYEKISQNDLLNERFEKVRMMRLASPKKATNEMAKMPFRFGEVRYYKSNSIVVPRHSSERRTYIPFDFVGENCIIADSAQAIYNAEIWSFGILTSKMHLIWIKSVCGALESRIRYSSALGYNTYPFPEISNQRRNEIVQSVMRIIEEREKHSDKTLAQLYDPDKMPDGLREAHRLNDIIIERCYRSAPFTSDEERLEYLFKLYEKMIAEETYAKASASKGKKGGGK